MTLFQVNEVEDEMREVLEETQEQKRVMDARIKQLSKAVSELEHLT